jgi:hypothetical protein
VVASDGASVHGDFQKVDFILGKGLWHGLVPGGQRGVVEVDGDLLQDAADNEGQGRLSAVSQERLDLAEEGFGGLKVDLLCGVFGFHCDPFVYLYT